MKRSLMLSAATVVLLCASLRAQDIPHPLCGVWALKTDSLAVESTYAPDGSYASTIVSGGQTRQVKGAWKAEGENLTVTLEGGKVSQLTWKLPTPVTLELIGAGGRSTRMTRLVRLPARKVSLGKPLDDGEAEMMTPLWWARQAYQRLDQLADVDRVRLGNDIHLVRAVCASSLASEGDLAVAGEILEGLPAEGEPRAMVLLGMARCLARAGLPAQARALAKGLEGDHRRTLLRAVVETLLAEGDFAAASESIKAMEEPFERARAYLALAACQLRRGQDKPAEMTFVEAWSALNKVDKANEDLSWEMASYWALQGDLKEAAKELNRSKADLRLAGYNHVVKALRRAGRGQQGAALLDIGAEQLAEMKGDDLSAAQRWLAWAWCELDEVEKAQAIIPKIEQAVRKSVAQAALAAALARKGLFDKANEVAYEIDVDFPRYRAEALSAIAEAAGQAGKKDVAERAIFYALKRIDDFAKQRDTEGNEVGALAELCWTRYIAACLPKDAYDKLCRESGLIDEIAALTTLCRKLQERLDEKAVLALAPQREPSTQKTEPKAQPKTEPKIEPATQAAPAAEIPKELRGLWEVFGPDLLMEVAADGTYTVVGYKDGKENYREQGAWRIEGERMHVTEKAGKSTCTWRITPEGSLEITTPQGQKNTLERAGRKLWGQWESLAGEQVVLTEFTPDWKYVVRVGSGNTARRIEGTYRMLGRSVEITVGEKAAVRKWKVEGGGLELTDNAGRTARMTRPGAAPAQPKAEPKAEPKTGPKNEPKSEPKTESSPAPKVDLPPASEMAGSRFWARQTAHHARDVLKAPGMEQGEREQLVQQAAEVLAKQGDVKALDELVAAAAEHKISCIEARARCLATLGRLEEALAEAKTAPQGLAREEAQAAVVEARLDAGDLAGAEKAIQEMEPSLQTEREEALLRLAVAQFARGQAEQGANTARAALKGLADIESAARKTGQAEPARQAARLRPRPLALLGEFDKALDAMPKTDLDRIFTVQDMVDDLHQAKLNDATAQASKFCLAVADKLETEGDFGYAMFSYRFADCLAFDVAEAMLRRISKKEKRDEALAVLAMRRAASAGDVKGVRAVLEELPAERAGSAKLFGLQDLAQALLKAGDPKAAAAAIDRALLWLQQPQEVRGVQDADDWTAECLGEAAGMGLGEYALPKIQALVRPRDRLEACRMAAIRIRKREREAPPGELLGQWRSGSGAVVEFTADGKYLVTNTVAQKVTRREGTYRVEGDRIEIRIGEAPALRRRWRVNSDKQLELHGEDGGRAVLVRPGATDPAPPDKTDVQAAPRTDGKTDGKSGAKVDAAKADRPKAGKVDEGEISPDKLETSKDIQALTTAEMKPSDSGHIVFVRYAQEELKLGQHTMKMPVPRLFVMTGEGKDAAQLVTAPRFVVAQTPAWTADGKKLLFACDFARASSSYYMDVFALDAVGGKLARLTGSEGPVQNSPGKATILVEIIDSMGAPDPEKDWQIPGEIGLTWKGGQGTASVIGHNRFSIVDVPAGRMWVKAWRSRNQGDVKLVDVPAGKQTIVGMDFMGGNYLLGRPSLSPDGRYLVATLIRACRLLVEGALREPRKEDQETFVVLDLQQDDGKIAFAWNPLKMNLLGKQPALSPNGRWVAFTGGMPPAESILVCSMEELLADKPQVRTLVEGQTDYGRGGTGYSYASWSPDGRRVAYCACRSTPHGFAGNLWTVRADGKEPQQLTRLAANQTVLSSCWSPDGRRLAFQVLTSKRDAFTVADLIGTNFTSDIYTVAADGSDLRKLTADGASAEPAWGP